MSLRRADASLRVALVTGACSGIGLSLATILASLGYTLILASNRVGPLREVVARLAAEHGVEAHAVTLDLARPEAAGEMVAAVEALGLEVDVLVLNAGIFFFGEVVDADPQRASALLQLHVVTPSLLCTLLGRGMRARGRGQILLVSSISAFRDFPGIAYYGSSKKYLRGFASALRCELAPAGVNVTCLAPGATATALYDPSVVPVGLAAKLGVMMNADDVARAGIEAMFRGDAECLPGVLTKMMTAAAVAVPQRVIDFVRRRGPWLKGEAR